MCTQGGLGEVRFHRRGSSTPRNELAAALLFFFPTRPLLCERQLCKLGFQQSALFNVFRLTDSLMLTSSGCYSACFTASQSVRDTGIVTVSPLLLRSFQRTRFGQRPAGSETADSHFPASRNKRSASVNDVCFSLCLCCFCLQFCTPHS